VNHYPEGACPPITPGTRTYDPRGDIDLQPGIIGAVSAKEQYMALRAERKGLVLDQLAFYAPNDAAVDQIKASLGLAHQDWTEDTVTGVARVWNQPPQDSKARLLFNYDLGIEVEILTYLEGPHWHEIIGHAPKLNAPAWEDSPPLPLPHSGFVSHIGFHVNEGELPRLPFRIAQELITEAHSNPGVAGRRYHYRIFDTRHVNGSFLKYIKRIQ
jgi:hypothetical protein